MGLKIYGGLADRPEAGEYTGQPFFASDTKEHYIWNGGEWVIIGAWVPVRSEPPSGMCKVLNVYWNPVLQKMVVDYDDDPMP